jgi:hypothetical protein
MTARSEDQEARWALDQLAREMEKRIFDRRKSRAMRRPRVQGYPLIVLALDGVTKVIGRQALVQAVLASAARSPDACRSLMTLGKLLRNDPLLNP